jgi:hypothetical protein
MRSLRDVGYDFVHAVADLVDNSIAANASEIEIEMYFDGGDSWLRVADNGRGMSSREITEAMRFGSERDYDLEDLGKFGLGLKTASLSQCTKLTVASRTDPETRRIEARQWDLDHVNTTNRWEIINLPPDSRSEALVGPLGDHPGTVVLWESLDRIHEYKIPWGERAKKAFLQTVEQLDLHLGMVFHRFLTGEARRRKKLKITINGTVVDPWDPFAREERATKEFDKKEFDVQTEDGRGLAGYAAYILPHQDQFSSPKAFNRYAGPAKWNSQQGFYIYRADRMIQSGGWCRMRTSDEHTKLARVALDFRTDLDSAFELNISKAKVNLPASLRDQLRPFLEELVREAQKVYRGASRHTTPGLAPRGIGNVPSPSSARTSANTTFTAPLPVGATLTGSLSGGTAVVFARETIAGQDVQQIGRAIEQAAHKVGEKEALGRIMGALRKDNPEIADGIGW